MRPIMILALAALPATVAKAQTNDHVYRSWRWETSLTAPRPAGLAGAFVAVADDSTATWLNPAGLTTLSKSELAAGILSADTGQAGTDRLTAWSGLSYVAGTGRLGKRFAIGGFLNRPRTSRIELSPELVLPDGSRADGFLDAEIIDGGAVAAYKLSPKVNLGARLTATHLQLEGYQRRYAPSGRLALEAGTAAGQTRVTGTLGILYQPTRDVRLGFLVTPGASYSAERTARDATGAIDGGSRYELRVPGLVAGGVAVRLGARLLVTAQVDYVRYSEITAFIRPGAVQATGYTVADGIEPRLAVEWSRPVGGLAVQLRGGIHSQAPGSLRFRGDDPVEAVAFPGSSRREIIGTGASVVTRSGLQFDIAGVFGGDRTELLGGCRLRF